MKALLVFLLFFQPQIQARDIDDVNYSADPAPEDYSCSEAKSDNPPFFISDEYKQGNKVWENLRDIDAHAANKYFLPRGSIVYSPRALVEASNAPDYKVPIKVLSIPKISTEKKLLGIDEKRDEHGSWQHKRFKNLATRNGATRTRAEIGSIGYIHKRALILKPGSRRKAEKFTFILQEDSPVFASPGLNTTLNDKLISPKMEDGKYIMDRCCTKDTFPGPEHCFDKYSFNILDKEQKLVGVLKADVTQCAVFRHLMPIRNNELDIMLKLIEGFDTAYPGRGFGLIDEIPARQSWPVADKPRVHRPHLVKFPVDEITGKGPYNSYHYKRDDKYSSDSYLVPTAACAFTEVLRKWNEDCKGAGCEVQFGDLYHDDSWGIHSSHDSGECIDIRPFRKNDDNDSGLTFNYTNYSRDRTSDFIGLLKDAGSAYVIFNDTKTKEWHSKDKDNGTVHDDHLHVCFRSDDSKVQKTCTEGLK